ncbi:MAG TPA: hypothetical protein VFI02_15080 [Armatimonadota bacterium]|nr:hypothetical protein [Armatimonadota bacterium]
MNEELERKEIEYARGKTAANDVRDDDGTVIVAKGQTITDDIINQAREKGHLHYLMLAAVASVVQAGGEQAQQRLREFIDVTEGHEADFVRGRQVACDVCDWEGNVIVEEGETLTDDIIEQATNMGLLEKLVLAVGAPGFHVMEGKKAVRPAEKMGYTPYPHT